MCMSKNSCYYALGAINYKNGFVTSCAQQSDYLHIQNKTLIPSKFFNDGGFKQHRLDLMAGKWPDGCDLCEAVEKHNSGKSMRMDYPADESYYNYDTGTVSFKGLKHVELRFSNSCNMACLHCSQVYSSGWISKLKHYVPDDEDRALNLDQLTGLMHRQSMDEDLNIKLSIPEVESIVNDLNKNFPNIEKIDFAGGEVLYQKQFFPCLELLAKHPNAKNILLTFHSNFNANHDPIKLSKLLEPFGESLIHMSIDAGKNIYPYFRDGNWDTLTNNISTFRSVNNFTELGVVCTTSAYQIMDIYNVFESFLLLDIDWIDASIVYTPAYINPAIMMFEFENEVLNDIEKTCEMIRQHSPGANSLHPYLGTIEEGAMRAINNIKEYITHHKPSYKDYETFLVYIKKSDKLWKQEFNNYMKNYKYINNKIVRVA